MTQPLTILVLPGLGDSGPGHWQSLWEAQNPACVRVQQQDWDRPELSQWLAKLDAAVRTSAAPVVLLAHSLACSLVAQYAVRFGNRDKKIRAALLVAPADVDSAQHTPPETRGFSPLPLQPLPFHTTVVASRNDPYVDFERACEFARAWGAELVDAGEAQHINAASGVGEWPAGKRCLEELLARSA
jgi:predicted alpha/beta hydrolase family esterase